jgi:hypothetical protein
VILLTDDGMNESQLLKLDSGEELLQLPAEVVLSMELGKVCVVA